MDFSYFEIFLQADKDISAKEGKKQIAWRTDVVNSTIELSLLGRYRYLVLSACSRPGCGDRQEKHFWSTLSRALIEGIHELKNGPDEIVRRHEKRDEDWSNIYIRIMKVA